MKGIFTVAALLIASIPLFGKVPKTEDEKTLYALGRMAGRSMASFRLDEKQAEFVLMGLKGVIVGDKEKVDMGKYGPKVREWVAARQKDVQKLNDKDAEVEKNKGKKFLEGIAKEKGVQKLPSGVLYKMMKEGKGGSPKATDQVKVHYHGTLMDGTVFDSSVDRGEPITFGLNQVIKCWGEGMQKVKKGGKVKLYCPSDVAYGNRGSPPKIKPGATLVFEVELLDIVAAKAPAHHSHDGHSHSKKKDGAK